MRYEVELVYREVKQVVVEATTAKEAIEKAAQVKSPVEVTHSQRANEIKHDPEIQAK